MISDALTSRHTKGSNESNQGTQGTLKARHHPELSPRSHDRGRREEHNWHPNSHLEMNNERETREMNQPPSTAVFYDTMRTIDHLKTCARGL